jgi:hypothetical protein
MPVLTGAQQSQIWGWDQGVDRFGTNKAKFSDVIRQFSYFPVVGYPLDSAHPNM